MRFFGILCLILLIVSVFCFNDQKDIARIVTPVGPELKKCPGVQEFIFKRSQGYSGLQVMFIGKEPELIIYQKEETPKQTHKICNMSADEIEKIVVDSGCKKLEKKPMMK